MKYELYYKISPPGYFGLPDGSYVVGKAGSGKQFTAPLMDTRTGLTVSNGSLPEYRSDDEALSINCSLGSASLRVNDNYFTLEIEASNKKQAMENGERIFDRFLRLLSAQTSIVYYSEFISIENEKKEIQVYPRPQLKKLIDFRTYNLTKLKDDIVLAARRASRYDVILEKATAYYEHARLMFEFKEQVSMFSLHRVMILNSAYLNLWKSISAILGDPKKDKDYQKRYKEYGLPSGYWKEKVHPIYRVRNELDIAHYSLGGEQAKGLEKNYAEAEKIAQEVIGKYADYINSQ